MASVYLEIVVTTSLKEGLSLDCFFQQLIIKEYLERERCNEGGSLNDKDIVMETALSLVQGWKAQNYW